jgi:rhomboid family GlyGly-CTERM serine protease
MKQQRWRCCAALCLAASLLMLWPAAQSTLMWKREALAQGQWWRLITAHLVHLGWRHCLLNLAALLLITELLWDALPLPQGLALLSTCALGVGILLWVLQPQLLWYAGLSGLLHGLWAGCAGAALIRTKSPIYAIALLALIIKLALLSGPASAMPVVPVAHWYGALCGLLWLALRQLQQRLQILD